MAEGTGGRREGTTTMAAAELAADVVAINKYIISKEKKENIIL